MIERWNIAGARCFIRLNRKPIYPPDIWMTFTSIILIHMMIVIHRGAHHGCLHIFISQILFYINSKKIFLVF